MVNARGDCPVVLSIAGSDSGGGAGIQADLKTFEALKVFGTSALTCVTAQSPDRVTAIHPVPPEIVFEQITVVCRDFPVSTVKTGMLYSAEIILAVAAAIEQCGVGPVILDPVMVATSGAELLRKDAVRMMMEKLFPLSGLITPNVPEAEILGGERIVSVEDAARAAALLSAKFGVSCVVKGGHLSGSDTLTDVLCHDGKTESFSVRRIHAGQTHGTGCAFSAAVAAFTARGDTMPVAVAQAGQFVANALKESRPSGRHTPLAFSAARNHDGNQDRQARINQD